MFDGASSRMAAIICVVVGGASCGILGDDIKASAKTAAKYQMSGDTLQGMVNTTLSNIAITVQDKDSTPLADTTLQFALTGIDGVLHPSTAVTDHEGVAKLSIDFGAVAGTGLLHIANPGGSSADIPVLVTPDSAAQIVALDDHAAWQYGTSLPQAARFRATDAFGNPIPNLAIHFTASHPGILLAEAAMSTNAAGEAVNSITTVSAPPGNHKITAAWQNGTQPAVQVDMHFAINAGLPAAIEITDGEPLAATLCGASFPDSSTAMSPLWFSVYDLAGNPVAGVTVAFSSQNGHLSLAPSLDISDTLGRVAAVLTTLSVPSPSGDAVIATVQSPTYQGATLNTACSFTITP